MQLPSFLFRIIPSLMTNGEEGLNPLTICTVLMENPGFHRMGWPVLYSILFPGVHLLLLPKEDFPWTFLCTWEKKCNTLVLPLCKSAHQPQNVFLQKDRLPRSRVVIWPLLHIKTNWEFQAWFTLLYSKFNTGRFCWKDTYSGVQRWWTPLNRRVRTLMPWRENQRESISQDREQVAFCK